MVQLQVDDVRLIKDSKSGYPMYLVHVRKEYTKTNTERLFTISQDTRDDYFQIVTKYLALRLKVNFNKKNHTTRLFLNYQKGRCTSQPIGINKFRSFPKEVAMFLNFPNPHKYTGNKLLYFYLYK